MSLFHPDGAVKHLPLSAFRENFAAARQYAARQAARTKMVNVELVCADCRSTFIWRTAEERLTRKSGTGRREYCDRCTTPAAKRRRALARKEAQ